MADKVTPTRAREKLLFGQIIKQHRKQARLTQGDLGEMLAVNLNTIKNWERDMTKPDHSLIPDLCTLLGIPLYELYQMKPAGAELSALESRVVNNLRQLNPGSRRAVDKMLSALMEEELLQKVSQTDQNRVVRIHCSGAIRTVTASE